MHFWQLSSFINQPEPTEGQTRTNGLTSFRDRMDDAALSDAVYETLVQRILTGRYDDTTVLSELAVARELGVSRTPVHDALRQLAKDGLIVQERNRRARVARFTPDDLFEIFELRKILEGASADLAAGRVDRRQLAPLRAMAEELRANFDAADWTQRWTEFDEAFHRTIAEACGNSRLCADIGRYRMLHRGFNKFSTDPKSLRRALAEHESILEALEQRDGPLASARMVAHISAWQEFFVRQLPQPAALALTTP